jgi:preprotein translocase subunit SecD
VVRRRITKNLILITVLVTLGVFVLGFEEVHLPGIDRGNDKGQLGLTLGLDLRGGSLLKYQADILDEMDISFDVVQLAVTFNPTDDQIEVVFDVPDGSSEINEAAVLSALDGVDLDPLNPRIALSENNQFIIRVREMETTEEETIKAALAKVSSIGSLNITKAVIRQSEVLTILTGIDMGLPNAHIIASTGNSFLIRMPRLGPDEPDQIKDALQRLAPVTDAGLLISDGIIQESEIVDIMRGDEVGHPEARIKASEGNRFTIQVRGLDPVNESQSIQDALGKIATIEDFFVRLSKDLFSEEELRSQLDGAVETIARRINALGTTEPQIQRFGSNRVVVQLPGVEDLDRAKDLIGQMAQLRFFERTCNLAVGVDPDTGRCLDFNDAEIPGGGLSGDDVSDAYYSTDLAGFPAISIQFNSRGTSLFSDLTGRIFGNNSKRIAIFLDDELLVAPVARAHVFDGVTQITGQFDTGEALDLATQIRSGAIPVPLRLISESTVDASLGEDSLEKSLKAGFVGLVLVLAFMVLYYRASGLVAMVALIIYAILLLAVFKMVPVTLTLAGMAGLILSMGMAVDANVLIFERVKEELRSGRTLSSAMDIGFRRAWTAIFDGNMSTLITCVILWWLGSRLGAPQVTGFALTLGIGVIVSMFTAVTVSRNLLQLMTLSPFGRRINLFTPEGIRRYTEAAGGEK